MGDWGGGNVERRIDGRKRKEAGKVTPDRRPTHSSHSLQTGYTRRWKMDGGKDMEQKGGGSKT